MRVLRGKPLLVWSINAVVGVSGICDTLVSTDDEVAADVARRAGALVPWLRPPELATDTATSVDVGLHAVEWYERERGAVDAVLLLQPTSPFRSRESIARGIELFLIKNGRPVVGVSPARSHPMRCFVIEGDRMRPAVAEHGVTLRSQDLPPVFEPNGAFYLVSPKYLRQWHSFYGPDVVPLLMDDPREAIDIDTPMDWLLAEVVAAQTEAEWGAVDR